MAKRKGFFSPKKFREDVKQAQRDRIGDPNKDPECTNPNGHSEGPIVTITSIDGDHMYRRCAHCAHLMGSVEIGEVPKHDKKRNG